MGDGVRPAGTDKLAMIIAHAATRTPDISTAEYFEQKAKNGPELSPLGRPCHDCAVTCGFYRPYTELLAQQPKHIQEEASLRWHCHNNPNRACRGNINLLLELANRPTP